MKIITDALKSTVLFLNRPLVKESIKKVAGTVSFAFGLVEAYDICQILKGREISTETDASDPKWMLIAQKVIILCAKISLILSAATSRPGVFIISTFVGCFFSASQLEKVFGPNTIFAKNPWHPRHMVSIASVILSLPAILQSTYKGISWAHKKMTHHDEKSSNQVWLTDSKLRLMTLFNTITSRPVLHAGNQFCQSVLLHS